ncbi:MAG: BolA/IbaG family iron-sulfur metabolism protein [Gammaproteobacteria bacterium]|nr:BolA/IbaG family iron-sulfur metabolism protein [Gammaproteobacteria bacterium]
MSMQTTIEEKLASEFDVDFLQVENESHMHKVTPGSELHFKVTIVSNSFNGQMLIKRHRMVNSALQQEMQQIHALALHTLTPREWQARSGSVADSPKCRGGGK